MSSECEQIQACEAWSDRLQHGWPEALRAHARGCPACGAVMQDLDRMAAAFRSLEAREEAEVASIDVSDAVLERIDAPARPPRKWAWVGLAAAAVLALLYLVRPPAVTIEPSAWAVWSPPDGPPLSLEPGRRTAVSLPGHLRSGSGPAHARLGQLGSGQLAAHTALRLERTDQLSSLEGSLRLRTTGPVHLRGEHYALEAAGDVEVASGHSKRAMEMSKKKLMMGGPLAVVVAVYAGWVSTRTAQGTVERAAPAGLAVGKDGRVAAFELDSRPPTPPPLARASAALHATTGTSAGPGPSEVQPAGAFWSQEDEAVRFVLEGEVIDGLSGEGLEVFTLEVEPVRLHSYAEPQRRLQIRDAEQGRFRLAGLGLGRWRILARAEGYAPVSQQIDLSEVSANPYLVLPLSRGGQLSGMVVDHSQQPVEGAKVGLSACLGERPPEACETQTTGANGRFTLERLPDEGIFSVGAEHPRLGSASLPNLRIEAERSENIVLELSGRLRVFGVVTRGKDAVPAEGIEVVDGSSGSTTLTDAQGSYSLLIPLEQRPSVHVVLRSGEAPPVKFASYPERRSNSVLEWVEAPTHQAELEKNFRLAVEQGRLFGRITDAQGRPAADVALGLHNTTGWLGRRREHQTFPEKTRTDADGRYRIDGVPAKAGYTVAYETAEGEDVPLGYVNVPSEEPVEANFEIGSSRLRGAFVDAETSEPFRIARHACGSLFGAQRQGEGRLYFVEPKCLEDGRFEFVDLPPGTYVLKGRLPPEMGTVRFEPTTVRVGPSEIRSDVQVPVEGEQADRWRLRVLDQNGRFVSRLYSRLQTGNRVMTSNLSLQDDGTIETSIDRSFETLYLDAQGYESAEIGLRGRDPAELITVHMRRTEAR